MKQSLIKEIKQEMAGVLNNAQRQKLDEVLEHCFFYVEVVSLDQKSLPQTKDNSTLKDEFLSAKQSKVVLWGLSIITVPHWIT